MSEVKIGVRVTLRDEPDCIIPAGEYTVSKVNPDGSFHCGGRTAVWPRRIIKTTAKTPRVGATRDE